ncbi:MAG TPA: OsmC family protein [Atribacterota bacterium]|nr:OsmC family protein [Atribacterota bacterium]
MVKCIATDKKYQCTIDLKSANYRLFLDTSKERGGLGDGISPHELLEAAAAACLNISIRIALDSLGIKADNVTVEVNLIRSVEGKSIFEYQYNIGDELNDEQKEKIEESILSCPVRQTLLKEICYKRIE